MHQVKIKSHYGQPIILEQCQGCGGIWFDESELFRAKQGEAENIESIDSKILNSPSEIKKPVLKCPRDQIKLFQSKDRYFPKGIILERCLSCSGIWLNRGDFTKFQKARQKLESSLEKKQHAKKADSEIEKVLTSYEAGNTNQTLANLGRFLATPIDRSTLTPLDIDQDKPETETTANIALNILMLLFRIFLFR
ncbi:MAG: zf-TFIIB domain-containing protein [Dehalococcoidia bacterium]|nr:MAG: zf-TFIIB domain-containing protein [Dehalococcoidia bacterium]